MKIKIPHLERRTRRDGGGRVIWHSFYWCPSAPLRRAGWKSLALGKDPDAAARMAIRQNADVARSCGPTTGTVADTIAAYRQDDEYPKVAATIRSYEQNLAQIERWAGTRQLAALAPKDVKGLKRALAATPYKANAICGMLRILYSFAIRDGLHPGPNPAASFRRITVQPRHQVWEPEHEAALARAALERNRPSLWIAMALSLYAGQRQTDCLKLEWQQYDCHRLAVRQSKTGVNVSIPVLGPLKRLLDVADHGTACIVTNEATGRPYAPDAFRHEIGALIEGIGLKGQLQYRDGRRTAVVRMHQAGLAIEEISGFTGHKIEACREIVETYLPHGRRITDAGIAKLESYYDRLEVP